MKQLNPYNQTNTFFTITIILQQIRKQKINYW